jgi:hypothetical protein
VLPRRHQRRAIGDQEVAVAGASGELGRQVDPSLVAATRNPENLADPEAKRVDEGSVLHLCLLSLVVSGISSESAFQPKRKPLSTTPMT